jgi:hypothetical protein
VGAPEDAFRCFMGTEIEALAIGNCYLRKARVHDHGKARPLLEQRNRRMVTRVCLAANGLHASGVIHLRDCRNIAARHVKLFGAEERLLFGRHRRPATYRAVGIQLKKLR